MEKNKDTINIALGQLMRQQRKDKKLSMQQIGNMVGITGQMVSLYELGSASITVSLLKKFCKIYGCKYYDLIMQASIIAGDNNEK